MKLFLILLLTLAMALSVFPAFSETEEPEIPVRKVTDYLFEITCDGYEQHLDEVNRYFEKYNPKLGG